MVAGVTSGPTAGPVPNGGGGPGGGSWTGSRVNARAPSAAAMPTRPSTERLRKRRRMLDMNGMSPQAVRNVKLRQHAFVAVEVGPTIACHPEIMNGVHA